MPLLSLSIVPLVVILLLVAVILRTWRPRSGPPMRVTVGQSSDGGRGLQHMMSAQLRQRGQVIHFERVDMREDGWEEKLAELVAGMKQKRRHLEAAQRIAGES